MEIVESIISQGHGHMSPRFLVIHETANPGATALNHVSYWRNNPNAPMTHYVTDWTGKVYHCVPDDRLCWHVGNANGWTVGIELCNTAKETQFAKVWDTAAEFAAWYLAKMGWPVSRMVSHAYCSATWGGSDHTDPAGADGRGGYFGQHGRTWAQFVQAVNERIGGDMPTPKELWDYQINGLPASERLYLADKQLYDRKDYSGRGKDGSTIVERVCWMAKKQEDQQKQLDRLEKKIDGLIKAVG